MKMGGGPKQFGVDAEQVPELLGEIGRAGLAFEGFHLFAGSQNLRAESICEAQQKSYELALRLAADAPAPVRFLNFGADLEFPTSQVSSDLTWQQSARISTAWCSA